MTSYDPTVQCHTGAAPPIGNCKHLFDSVRTTETRNTFGPPNDPQADVKLPKELHESGHQCKAIIRTAGETDTSSFYEVWEAIVAVSGMCVRFGHAGTALQRGTWTSDDRLPSMTRQTDTMESGAKKKLSISLEQEPRPVHEA
ncbi:MAG: hypothetical protein Q9188_007652 [Gyalolechia gomerana]